MVNSRIAPNHIVKQQFQVLSDTLLKSTYCLSMPSYAFEEKWATCVQKKPTVRKLILHITF